MRGFIARVGAAVVPEIYNGEKSMANNVAQERRQYVRVAAREVLNCRRFTANAFMAQDVNERISAVTKNLSAGGVLFESPKLFEVGTLLKLEIDLPGWEVFKREFYKKDAISRSEPLIILATVVRVEIIKPEKLFDIGVCFAAIDEGHRWALMQYIEHHKRK
ncbi:MAG: PilZ domain-containing protein [Candidatus Omnitrophica bacterium]|nr:PilZ domain-containing protein [Candidatus Omnitrophota bacterium]